MVKKDVRKDEYRINARNIANGMWGGDCTATQTTRHGAHYYSCAAHGGYVVDPQALTEVERHKIEVDISPENLYLCVQHRPTGDYVMATDYRHIADVAKKTKCHFNTALGSAEWVAYPVYVFEEDVDWAILEHHTDIRVKELMGKPERAAEIEETYQRWKKAKENR